VSGIGLIMDLLLAALLVAALLFGWRLDRKLKALRDGQNQFANAVAELDQASRRAEFGLASLREVADETHDSLHDRILKAREVKQALEILIVRAEKAREAQPAMASPVQPRTPAPPPVQAPVEPRAISPDRVRAALLALTEERAAATRPAPTAQPQAPTRAPAAPSTSRPAPRGFDDDLFDSAGDR
jgi:hypothetical protein